MPIAEPGPAQSRKARRRSVSRQPAVVQLTDLDHDVLGIVCRLRVVTQRQLERLHPGVAERTLRYRVLRLQRLGLVGRTRPYRDRGSAPYHVWPTSRADALVRGQPPPRRGERRPPNPLFLAHVSAVSELYVVLRTRAAEAALTLVEFCREGEARETFEDLAGRARAIAPDARVALRDEHGRLLRGNVELDLGTMTHARLRRKLEGYLAYGERFVHASPAGRPPALLFITTSAPRADAFLHSVHAVHDRERWGHRASALQIAVSHAARDLDAVLVDRAWRTTRHHELRTLSECLVDAVAAINGHRAA